MTKLPGLVLMGFSALSFSLMAVGIKALRQDHIPVSEIVFFRGLLCGLFTLAAFRASSTPMTVQRPGLLALRGIIGLAGLYLYCLALGSIPLPDAVALQYTHPIFAAVFAALLLREKMPKGSGVAMAICAAGALIILDPKGTGHMAGNLIAVCSGATAGLAYACVRALHRTESPLAIILSFHLAALLFGGIVMATEFVWPVGTQWLLIAAVAAVSQAGQWFLTHGLRKERAGVATTVGYLAVAFGAIWAWLFFDETVEAKAIVGTVLMVGGLVVLSRRAATRPSP